MKRARLCEAGFARRSNPQHGLTALFALTALLAACQPAPATPTSTPIAIPSAALSTATSAPTNTAVPMAVGDSLLPADMLGPVPTLAPFPLSEGQLEQESLPDDTSVAFEAPVALSPHDHFYFARPVARADLASLIPSQRYGVLQEAGEIHDAHLGTDIGLNARTPVKAAGSGTVVWADYGLLYHSIYYIDDPYGISVVIRHDFGLDGERLYTVYAHLAETKVEVGDRVEAGQLIALSGNTGLTTGPHLHFEVRLGGNTIYFTRNPELWVAPPEGSGVLVGRVATNRDSILMNKLVEVTSLDSGHKYSMYTYATEYKLLPDDYYNENFVLGDLPAGRYEVAVPYYGVWRRTEVEITAGAITYFHLLGTDGYNFDLPGDPLPENLPRQ